jgi:hypothetical protein
VHVDHAERLAHEYAHEQPGARPEVQVHRALADAGVLGDLFDGDALVAPPQDQVGGGVQNPLFAVVTRAS